MVKYDSMEALEAAARAVEADWCPNRAAILNVFCAYPARSMPPKQIQAIAEAAESVTLDAGRVQLELTKLVRAKFFRTQIVCGVRRYEVTL